uniref:Uncharacterized protein n=1 Tax=Picea sitchensis TaxID=3332 RepID=A9NX96_PICSI|nr:unknown [Picea sitchensis]
MARSINPHQYSGCYVNTLWFRIWGFQHYSILQTKA